ncbi:nitroreductase family protein [Ruminococcus sp. CLA-AA-H200]|uniref:Nitroreductase family protein n=1 Tax=Ruminococcus turbiniformis TaxID=2881258 RepID=A0ABS8FXK1_9FIRM|nr:nitroreductase family protein [Ruminococcus turbiniformis]MCC2254708.1 nitroreductase family protein [Ruminococcus turbiniformis]
MNVTECLKTRRSIRRYKADPIDHSMIESVVSLASYSPSWKNTQITRYLAIEDKSLLGTIADRYVPDYNANIIRQAPVLIAVTFVRGRCGYERDGSFTTKKGDRWQMFDVGAACQTFCLAAWEHGLGTVIMGVFDEDGISGLLDIPQEQELAALVALGYPDIAPDAPKRKGTEELLQFR